MPNITLVVPADLHRKMKRHPEVKWSEVVRRILRKKVEDLERMDRIAARSELTPQDVDELAHLVNRGLYLRYKRRQGARRSAAA